MEWKARALPVTVAIVCLVVAITWPGWRYALAQAGDYDSSFLGCTNNRSGDFVVVFSQGLLPGVVPGSSCDDAINAALNNAPAQCIIGASSSVV